jgi:hypothetical protein
MHFDAIMTFLTRGFSPLRAILVFGIASQAAVPQVSIVTSFTGVTLPPQVSVVPVRFKVDGGPERTMDIPLTCTSMQCTGDVAVYDSLQGSNSKQFTVARTTDSAAPIPLNLLQHRQSLALGRTHALMVRAGEVWSFGWNHNGQLGWGLQDSLYHPNFRKIPGLSRIISVSVGRDFSMALDSSGDVWTWGSNYRGVLGNGQSDPQESDPRLSAKVIYNRSYSISTPKKILSGKRIMQIECGPIHALALGENGYVYGWGSNSIGCYWNYSLATKLATPKLIDSMGDVWRVSAGGDNIGIERYFSFSLILRKNGTLWGAGEAGWGQLGSVYNVYNGAIQVPLNLSSYTNPKLTSLRSGDVNTYFDIVDTVTKQRKVVALGRNVYGALPFAPLADNTPILVGVGSAWQLGGGGAIMVAYGRGECATSDTIRCGSWRGKTRSTSGIQNWEVLKVGSQQPKWKYIEPGIGSVVGVDSADRYYCIGWDSLCSIDGSNQSRSLVTDTNSIQSLQISGLGDTLYVPNSTYKLALNGLVAGEVVAASGAILCGPSGCFADLIGVRADGRIGVKKIVVKVASLQSNQLSLNQNDISSQAQLTGAVTNSFMGAVYLNIYRIGPGGLGFVKSLYVGEKNIGSWSFNVAPNIAVSGDYYISLKIAGSGWVDSAGIGGFSIPDAPLTGKLTISNRDIFPVVYSYASSIPKYLRFMRLYPQGVDTVSGSGLYFPGEKIDVGIFKRKTHVLVADSSHMNMYWSEYSAGNIFRLKGFGVDSISVAVTRAGLHSSQILEIGVRTSGVDSANIEVFFESGELVKRAWLSRTDGRKLELIQLQRAGVYEIVFNSWTQNIRTEYSKAVLVSGGGM